ncbi:MAG: hypothetical protein AB7U20_10145 [Planctomycetaceae bacterium]
MSKQSLPKSLISAYFDGEVSAEERASVSRAAEKSPVVQQVLDDYAQLSRSLNSLKENAPSPQLRDAVLAEIQALAGPQATRKSPAPAPLAPLFRRHWKPMAGGVAAAIAAGMLLMFWPGAPRPGTGLQTAHHDAGLPSQPLIVAASDAPGERMPVASAIATAPPSSPAAAAADSLSSSNPNDAPRFAARDADEEETNLTSIPEEWFTQQHAKDRHTPRPGDVMNYMLDVADETVVIPVTVVDVQRTAGQIRVLLASHGIQPLAQGGTISTSNLDESSVAILVESDWERLPSVMDALDTQGLEVARYVESSPTAKRMIMAQNALETVGKTAAEQAAPVRIAAAPAAPAPAAARERRDAPAASSESLTEVLRGLFFEAPVTDEFVEEIEQRQHAIVDDAVNPALADSRSSESPTPEEASGDRAADVGRKFGVPLASKAPARLVFLIKKSGRAP